MDAIRIRGGRPLTGAITISGAKNAALPLLTAALLTDGELALSNLPDVADIATMTALLEELGVEIGDGAVDRGQTMNAATISSHTAPYDLVRKMRASVLVLGPLLAREGRARVSLPGGCAIGPRPVDIHLAGLSQLGAEIDLNDGYVDARAPNGLTGARIALPVASVGATENLMMAATLANGETVIANAAREPEIVDLSDCLSAMGAQIAGAGTDTITVQGVDALHGARHEVLPDRIETGTYAVAAAITGGALELINGRLDLIEAVAETLDAAGVDVSETARGLNVARRTGLIEGFDVMTAPYPGFPTDMQAQMMALMAVADGASLITESIFENRFMHVPELARMGANITVHGGSAMVRGVPALTGAPVMATDLRASVSLVLAGLAARDETVVNRVYHLDRGYERVEQKLAACGADIERVPA
jgi:UDP-N-acetylglucosamine 1-carboxyvinyltransferase